MSDNARENSESKLLAYCTDTFDLLKSEADEHQEWEGLLTNVVERAGVPRSWYTLVMQQMYGLGCVERIQMGTRYQLSRVKLVKHPTEVTWKKVSADPLTGRSDLAILRRELDDLRRQLGGLPIVNVLQDFEERLSGLEDAIQSVVSSQVSSTVGT